MSQPVPEESNEALEVTEQPADEHDDDLPDEADDPHTTPEQQENAGTALDQPSSG
ncbi:hypothetical protein [Nocardioides sp. GXQ0305]|uniref:hypothetical protein n=1 Tax=Nocardioides sp. GXQ0305 TaxID=3423912 RepID=UPI003D7EF531